MEALEKARAVPSDEGGGPSGLPGRVPKRTRGVTCAQLLRSISDRFGALERDVGLPGPALPASPDVPVVPVPMSPSPSPVVPDAPVPADPTPLEPAEPVVPGRQVQGASTRVSSTLGTHAGRSLAPWQVEAQRAIAASLAPSTRTSYASRIAAFACFRRKGGLEEFLPVPVVHLLQFLVQLRGLGRAMSTLGGSVLALSFAAQAQGVGDCTGEPRVKRMLEGWSRGLPPAKDRRQPFTLDLLTVLCGQLQGCCGSQWEVSLFRAAALVAFLWAFRPGELLPRSRFSATDRCLHFTDLSSGDGEARILLRFSKTDQRGRGHMVRLCAAVDSTLCPVVALQQYVGMGPYEGGPLFVHEGGASLTQYQFLSVLQRALATAGVATLGLTLHSFHIGAATTASHLGFREEEVQRIGRWRSKAIRRYVR
ncbi:uncharacterized protein LOC128344384 [Hemicordylus capensis]|uniref:uncharacterized protein LOC128344384 n=1 Tax=Hemicordylus capensis TaxID=884348 RepID=UPI0023044D39|nr:uncharacterized protein LOC128344384 [Hemicordylus capensis]